MNKTIFKVVFFFFIAVTIASSRPIFAASDGIEMTSSAQSDKPIKQLNDIQRKAQELKLRRFLTFYKSPLVENVDEIIEAANSCGMKPELIIAISGVESTFGQNYPEWSNNPLGWGIYGNQIASFPSIKKAFEAASCGIVQKYPNDSQTDIEKLGVIYNGVTPNSWSSKVHFFLTKMEMFNPSTETLEINL